jgi:hypothetical protein
MFGLSSLTHFPSVNQSHSRELNFNQPQNECNSFSSDALCFARHPDDATADQEDVSETGLAAPRRALTRRFWMLPNPFLKRPSGSQAHAHQSHEADFDWR